jgi:hypothetical protein
MLGTAIKGGEKVTNKCGVEPLSLVLDSKDSREANSMEGKCQSSWPSWDEGEDGEKSLLVNRSTAPG